MHLQLNKLQGKVQYKPSCHGIVVETFPMSKAFPQFMGYFIIGGKHLDWRKYYPRQASGAALRQGSAKHVFCGNKAWTTYSSQHNK